MIRLALPRDLVLLIFVGWLWVGFWTSDRPQEDPYENAGRVFMERWLGTRVEVERSGLERLRNGWTFAVATVLAVGLCWLFVFILPFWWL